MDQKPKAVPDETVVKVIFTAGLQGVRVEIPSALHINPRKIARAEGLLRRAFRDKHAEGIREVRRREEEAQAKAQAERAKLDAANELKRQAAEKAVVDASEKAEFERLKKKFGQPAPAAKTPTGATPPK